MFLTCQLAEACSFNTHLLSEPLLCLPGTRRVSEKWQNPKGLEEFRARRALLTRDYQRKPSEGADVEMGSERLKEGALSKQGSCLHKGRN